MGIWYAYRNITRSGIRPYSGNCPPYYNLDGEPWFDQLNKNLPEIQKSVSDLFNATEATMKEYYNTSLVENGQWVSKPFLVWGISRSLMKTGSGKAVFNYFKDIPGLVSLSISVLKPKTHIKPHSGDTDATYRVHIPIHIPSGLPECGIMVNGISKPWTDDKVVAFCDAYVHEAWNHSDKIRVVLIADIVRPEYRNRIRRICFNVLCWLLLQKIWG